ncbi:hypothetical protein EDC17_101114 [Sphingobacterium alimentarium]|uniref:Uncharacterized protein n=1 Tax=Sphingobacterium alimentarium TaxID=797292 RepID=A0A4R3VX95_9SPHI|nr:hypothetical protein [Sphingobacterium alimentarium]TCV17097.1 hypothetical protein EDC17_101114 [Sphingobacterium alimentarium]
MEIIKIDKQPSVTDYIAQMDPNGESVKRFHLQHIKAVREAAGRKMKFEKPNYKYETTVNAIDDGGYIEVVVSEKKRSANKSRRNNEISI